MNDALEEQRVMLLEQLRALQMEYQARAKPIVDQLVRLESLRPPKPFIVPADPDGNLYLPPRI